MNSLKIKKNDTVVVLSGKDKGKQGKVLGTIPSEAKVVVEGINKVTCHIKPRKQGEEGGITQREAAIYASKVQVVCPKCGKGTRVAYVIKDGKKARTLKKWLPLSSRSSVTRAPCRSPRSRRSLSMWAAARLVRTPRSWTPW